MPILRCVKCLCRPEEFLARGDHVECGKQRVGGHSCGECEALCQCVALGGTVLPTRKTALKKVCFGDRIARCDLARKGREQVVKQLLLLTLDTKEALCGKFRFATLLAENLRYV